MWVSVDFVFFVVEVGVVVVLFDGLRDYVEGGMFGGVDDVVCGGGFRLGNCDYLIIVDVVVWFEDIVFELVVGLDFRCRCVFVVVFFKDFSECCFVFFMGCVVFNIVDDNVDGLICVFGV